MKLFEDQEFVLKDCTERLEALNIQYMLTGSMAMVKYAMMRMTNDIDIVLELKSADTRRFIQAFEPDYYVPHDSVRHAIDRSKMFNVLHRETVVKVDCVIKKPDPFQKIAFENRRRVDYSGFDLWIISKEDLVLSKLNWAKESRSEMQMRDVANILRNGFDEDYVNSWAKRLGIEDILADCIELIDLNNAD